MLGWLNSIGDAIATFLSFASSMLSGILSVFGLVGTCFTFLTQCFTALPTPLFQCPNGDRSHLNITPILVLFYLT